MSYPKLTDEQKEDGAIALELLELELDARPKGAYADMHRALGLHETAMSCWRRDKRVHAVRIPQVMAWISRLPIPPLPPEYVRRGKAARPAPAVPVAPVPVPAAPASAPAPTPRPPVAFNLPKTEVAVPSKLVSEVERLRLLLRQVYTLACDCHDCIRLEDPALARTVEAELGVRP